ncbi:ABC transporter ATP-binding protein [Paenibacillus pinihumi]|uniref:ABC transporter ATP-binding protein n=1 Tax=Paenibacillus pinihumi TaxID=669462 RepID=UPI0004084C1B|nr:ABC transporter ATP-binding protein [Paenibacillus pinihumi]
MSAAPNMIELDNLTRLFDKQRAVDNLTISVPTGEIFAFLGSNGAGKTTTMKMMTGQLKPSSGTIRIKGVDMWKDKEIRQITGYVPDVPLLHEGLTAREMLRFVGGLYGLGREDIHKRTEALLGQFDLLDSADKLIKAYSLGMKRKTAIACGLIHNPEILFLDEVTNGLDPKAAREVKNQIHKAAKENGVTVFLTTHILDVVEEMADRIAILDAGKIQAIGTLEELRQKRGMASDSKLEEIFLSLIERGGQTDTLAN